MKSTRLIAGSLLVASLASHTSLAFFIPLASAQYVDTPECQQETFDLIAHEKRIERSVLFGQKPAKESEIGSVRFDRKGNAWMKKDTNAWNSLAAGYQDTTWSDSFVDNQADVDPRRGLFEQKRTSTSDLIPALTQTFRAYQCRLRAVCAVATLSQTDDAKGKTKIDVQPDGCIKIPMPVLKDCTNGAQATVSATSCDDAVDSVLAQEQQIMVLLTSYDSAYRTLLQFQGVFEGFLSSFRFALVNPLWQTVRVIGGLTHLPCFLSQCDE